MARFKVAAAAIAAIAVLAGIAGVVIVVMTSGSDDPQQHKETERPAGSTPVAGTSAGTSAPERPSVGASTPAAASCALSGTHMGLYPIAEVSRSARWVFAPDVVV